MHYAGILRHHSGDDDLNLTIIFRVGLGPGDMGALVTMSSCEPKLVMNPFLQTPYLSSQSGPFAIKMDLALFLVCSRQLNFQKFSCFRKHLKNLIRWIC